MASVNLGAVAQSKTQDSGYPDRPIRLIVPVSVVGSTDIVARIIASKLSTAAGVI